MKTVNLTHPQKPTLSWQISANVDPMRYAEQMFERCGLIGRYYVDIDGLEIGQVNN